LLVALLTGEAITLPAEATEAGLAIGRELLAIDEFTRLVEDEAAIAAMIGEMKLERGRRVAGLCGSHSNHCRPLPVIHDMDAVVLGRLGPAPATMLEERAYIMCDLYLATLLAYQLLHALARGVAEILREERGLGAFGLDREGLQQI